MANKKQTYFGEEKTTAKTGTARGRYARGTKKTTETKTTGSRRKTTEAPADVGFVTFSVPATIAFELGVYLGRTYGNANAIVSKTTNN